MRDSAEFRLIARIGERLATTRGFADARIGIGDDAAAVVEPAAAGVRLVSVDGLAEGAGFRRGWASPAAIGAKALAAALSDLAAMGAVAAEAYVQLGVPADLPPEEALGIADGIAEVAERERVAVLGGDLTAAETLVVGVTVIGHAPDLDLVVGRAGARAGDALCVSGEIGAAGAGLMLLEHPRLRAALDPAGGDALISAQLRPRPRLALGHALAAAGAAAMIDVSDGLGADAEQLAAASGLGLEVDLADLPIAPGVVAVAGAAGRDPVEVAASAGEDYELLCAIPRARLDQCHAAAERLGTALTEIGRFVAGRSTRLRLPGGRSIPASGHDHLDSPPGSRPR